MYMKNNLLFKILASLPIILLMLYFIPFLGIILILFRFFVYSNKKISTSIYITLVGILILIPKIIYFILGIFKIDINTIPYLQDVLNSDLYNINFINYSKLLICIGIIFLIISFALTAFFNKLNIGILNYISKQEKMDTKISRENDMKIKIKQEKAKNTSYVKCPYCGSDNLLSEKVGICQYCRRKIENKNYKC